MGADKGSEQYARSTNAVNIDRGSQQRAAHRSTQDTKRQRERDNVRDNMASRVFILLATLLAFNAAWAKLDVLIESPTISAKPGDKVQMKCILQNFTKPLVLKDLMVQWFTRGTQVAEFDDKITISKQGLSMSLDDLQKGEATLTIDSFSADNAGNYRCYVYYKSDTSMKQIILSDASKPIEEDNVQLSSCETALDKKLDIVVKLLEKVDTRLDELKKCPK